MATRYASLPHTHLPAGVTYHRPAAAYPEAVALDSPAIQVMTDLRKVSAVTIEPTAPLSAANEKMIANGVRLLLVTDVENAVLGLITATDVLGEKPVLYMQRNGGTHQDIQVQHIMTPQKSLEVLHLVDIDRARVGDIVATLKRCGRQHAMVIDINEVTMQPCIRGIFSTTQISRQLGERVEVSEIAQTFAEVESALSHTH